MLIPNCPDEALRHDLDALGRAYLDALASQDWRASDRHLVRLRTKLGTILALLGWHPDDGRPDVVVTGGVRPSLAGVGRAFIRTRRTPGCA